MVDEASFGLLGATLGHSYSPQIHEMLGSAPYRLIERPTPEDARAFLRAGAFRGVNVTIPYKRVAYACCDELSDAAARLRNVNTVVRRADGTLFGDNTDYHGFLSLLGATLGTRDLRGTTCLVLGDGGASLTIQAALADCGARVLVASRHGALTYPTLAADEALRGQVGVIVNATPVGMYPHADDPLLVDPADYPGLRGVVDIVYNPLRTRLVQRARELGLPARGGLRMLVSQAKLSSDAFLGERRPEELEGQTLSRLVRRLANVSLIGMPGSGKTTVGRRLAALLGRELVDVDELVARDAGRPIPEIFAAEGEDGFRRREVACTARACARPGRVIATGGGVVTRPENLGALRANGLVALLERGLADDGTELDATGRPLSQTTGVARLRAERRDAYEAWADASFGGPGAREVAARIAAWFERECDAACERW